MLSGSLILDLNGETLSEAEATLLRAPEVGGVILFGRNTQSAQQVAQLTAQIRAVRPDIVIAVDQEGGRVQRLRQGVSRLPPMAVLGELYSEDAQSALQGAADIGYLMASELRALDIDISFAPVLDLDLGRNEVIANRAFSNDPALVSRLGAAVMTGMADAGMKATGKHFPGHGWADVDTHMAEAIDSRSFETVWQQDLVPFRSLVEQGLAAIMPAHVVYPACDPNPAGFSPFWLQQVLRQRLAFQGAIFSDDLTMVAARQIGGYAARAEAALKAGCDALLPCNNREGALEVLEYLKQHNVTPSPRLAVMRGASPEVDPVRFTRAKQLAEQLCERSQTR